MKFFRALLTVESGDKTLVCLMAIDLKDAALQVGRRYPSPHGHDIVETTFDAYMKWVGEQP